MDDGTEPEESSWPVEPPGIVGELWRAQEGPEVYDNLLGHL